MRAGHAVEREVADEVALFITIQGWRQCVIVGRATCDGTLWLVISAPVAWPAHAQLAEALRLVSRSAVGLLALEQQQLLLRHAEPLHHVVPERLDELCHQVALGALEVNALVQHSRSRLDAFHHFAD